MFGLQKPSHLFAYLLIVFPVAGLAESSQPPARRLSLQSATDALINKNLTVSLDSSLQVGSSNITSLPDQVLDTIEGDLDLQPVSMGIEEIRRLALVNRPDLGAAQFAYDAAEAALKLAEAERVRDVTIGGQYARAGRDTAVGIAVGVPLSTRARGRGNRAGYRYKTTS